MDLIYSLIILAPVHLLAAASPGPDFVLVSQQALTKGKKAGIYCSIGVALGQGVHILYSIFGLAVIIANSVTALTAVKVLGAFYLFYLGVKGLRSKPGNETVSHSSEEPKSSLKAVKSGFFCNVFNPKAPIYFVSLFTLVLSPEMPLIHLIVLGFWIMILQFFWFAAVSLLLSSKKVNAEFKRFKHKIDRLFGAIMIALGVKVLSD